MNKKKRVKRILLLVELLGVILWVGEYVQSHVVFDNRLVRGNPTDGVTSHELRLDNGNGMEDVVVEVYPKRRSPEEVEALLDAAESEVEASYLGSNKDADVIQQKLNLQTSYVDGCVEARWQISPLTVMDTDGTLRYDNISEPTKVIGELTLSCEGEKRDLKYQWMVYPPSAETKEGFEYELNRSLQEAEESTRDSDAMELPSEIGDRKLTWIPKMEHTGLQLCLLGIGAVVAIGVAEKEEKKQAKQKLEKALQSDYPNIVNWLSLYVGAGISVKQAFAIIGKKATEEHPGYEAILRCSRAIADGKSEMAAYEDLSEYAPNKNYRKLSLLITHHIRKGSEDLMFQLEREAQAAFEQRKMQARIAGEEASTKLLIPMMGLLGIVLVVLIIPALQGINI
ncbi:MAG: type II secretion system F family protein [Lachnospiraceae bacterium]|nr:type II secretion system F family protein [Lachnospiraceae bacterium]